jgi:hypothetical protein
VFRSTLVHLGSTGKNLDTSIDRQYKDSMSADNIIRVRAHGGDWHVWEGSASFDYPDIPTGCPSYMGFTDKEEALAYAFQLERQTGYVEYGVSVEEPVFHPEPNIRWSKLGQLQQEWKDCFGHSEWRKVPVEE